MSLRSRTTLAATGVVGVVLIAVAIGLVALPRASLLRRLDTVLHDQADDVLFTLGSAPASGGLLPVPGSFLVVEEDGDVLAAGGELRGVAPAEVFGPAPPTPPGEVTNREINGDPFRVLLREAPMAAGSEPVFIAAAAPLEGVNDAVAAIRNVLVFTLPALLGLVALVTWKVAGRALAPVERIRAEVADISSAHLHRRVPEPGTDDEIGRLARTMNEMLDRLDSAADRQRQFVSDASHELRSPLTAIRTELEVGLQHPDQADWEATAQRILSEDLRMQRLVDDLLLLARSDEGAPVSDEEVDLDELVLAEVARMRVAVDVSGVTAVRAHGDRHQLTSVVRNLLDNAERHARSKVVVSLTPPGELAVEDDGPGVPVDDRERVFERFARLDEGRNRSVGGAGLGLALVRAVVQRHGGTVHLEDGQALDGARFVVRLPPPPSR